MRVREWFSDLIERGKHAGGGAPAYFEDGSHIGKGTHHPTPFDENARKALSIVDRNFGYAMQVARTWQLVALIAIGGTIATGFGWWYESQKFSVEYVLIGIDEFGNAGDMTPAANYTPSQEMYAAQARLFIQNAFSRSTDMEVNKSLWKQLNATIGGEAIAVWKKWWETVSQDQPDRRTIEFLGSPRPRSQHTYYIRWRESDWRGGNKISTRDMEGNVTFDYQRPKNRMQANINAGGIYTVTGLDFARIN